ncbi:hypothetical protein SOVF_031910 [Spinacia oleracea]|nr:hypothetical protein SOVF_031910 [Spinacia oleracea]
MSFLELYGHITLTDDLDNTFTLFRRDVDDPKTVFLPDNQLRAKIIQNFELQTPRVLPKTITLHFYLLDKYRNIVILDEKKFIDCSRELPMPYDKDFLVSYDKYHMCGKYSSCLQLVDVSYIIFKCAISACVGIAVVETGGEGGNDGRVGAQVSGTISASNKATDMKVMVLNKSPGEELKLEFGAFAKLSYFAVPSYSLLDLEAKLNINGEQISSKDDDLLFEPTSECYPWYQKEIVGKKCRVLVFVSWRHAIYFPDYDLSEFRGAHEEIEYPFSVKKKSSIPKFKEKGSTTIKSNHTNEYKSFDIKPRVLASSMLEKRVRKWKSDVEKLVEVFSISICSSDGGLTSTVYGKISCIDYIGKFVIFKRDKKKLERVDTLQSDGTVQLGEPGRCYMCPFLCLNFDIKDDQDREICVGYVSHDSAPADSWLNRRLCSVVRGQYGYAAVYYTIFSDALEAKLKCTVESVTGRAVYCQVSGKIIAMYSNSRYPTIFEKKFYRSTLFNKGKGEFVDSNDGKIPLEKSLVAVSRDDKLIVAADICVRIDGYPNLLKFEAMFTPENPEKRIISVCEGSNYSFSVSVEWSQ